MRERGPREGGDGGGLRGSENASLSGGTGDVRATHTARLRGEVPEKTEDAVQDAVTPGWEASERWPGYWKAEVCWTGLFWSCT